MITMSMQEAHELAGILDELVCRCKPHITSYWECQPHHELMRVAHLVLNDLRYKIHEAKYAPQNILTKKRRPDLKAVGHR